MKKRIFAISGSTRSHSANATLIQVIADFTKDQYEIEVFAALAQLPHFNPDLDKGEAPSEVVVFRNQISAADAVLICTPEYVFSLPGSLKNALEWMVSTTILSGKPSGLITASANGKKGQQELNLIMKTLGAKFNRKTTLLISGVKGKVNGSGHISDEKTLLELQAFLAAFDRMLSGKR